jgi:Circadian oscillating protein COP23
MSLRQLGLRGVGLSLAGATMLMSSVVSAQTTPGGVVVNTEPGGSVSTGTGTTPSPSGSATTSGTRFESRIVNGQYTVVYIPDNQATAFPWAVPSALGGGWNPERRSAEIARRLQSYLPDGLVEMKTGVENGYNTVCVTTERVPTCRIVFTVPPGQDPMTTRDRVFQNLATADTGQSTQGVYTYGRSNRDNDILGKIGNALGLGGKRPQATNSRTMNLKPFLSKKDGGTGEKLTGGVSIKSPTTPKARPRIFR